MFGGTTAMAPPPAAQDETGREELKQITGKVVAVSRTSSGILELRLDNDQVWRQNDVDNSVVVENGDSVTISRASLGTFRLTDKRGRSARFKRVR
jgi:outer membrane lipoprotein-sorting protein